MRRLSTARPLPALAALLATLLAPGALACFGRSSTEGVPSPLQAGVLRASQAPIVSLPDILVQDSLVGKRVRVLGWCAAAPGILGSRRRGAWMLATPDTSIEVRGLVPEVCTPEELGQTLVLVFAQVVPASPKNRERLLLRLPD